MKEAVVKKISEGTVMKIRRSRSTTPKRRETRPDTPPAMEGVDMHSKPYKSNYISPNPTSF